MRGPPTKAQSKQDSAPILPCDHHTRAPSSWAAASRCHRPPRYHRVQSMSNGQGKTGPAALPAQTGIPRHQDGAWLRQASPQPQSARHKGIQSSPSRRFFCFRVSLNAELPCRFLSRIWYTVESIRAPLISFFAAWGALPCLASYYSFLSCSLASAFDKRYAFPAACWLLYRVSLASMKARSFSLRNR